MKLNIVKIIGFISIIYGILKYRHGFINTIVDVFQINNPFDIKIAILTASYFLLYVVSGIGLLLGKKWGWHLAVFNFIFLAIRSLETLSLSLLYQKISGVADVHFYPNHLFEIMIMILIGALLVLFLTRKDILKQFHIERKLIPILGLDVFVSLTILIIRDLTDTLAFLKNIG